ncbi:N-acetylated-alpha-linked acidic dipeptidase 2-like isoform X2 [Dendronephthya gigantea]|nr:N-acetylated-alpha-linked acidic dipeptidase 2-like isoform X2 [Dendronephthya gigantea]
MKARGMSWFSERKIMYKRMELEKYHYTVECTMCCLITFHSGFVRSFPFVKGILLAILIGFLLGYFLPKCDDNDNDTTKTRTNGYDGSPINRIMSVMNSKAIENISREFSSAPHLAASPRDMKMAKIIEKRWKDHGFDDVELPTYEVLLSFPNNTMPNKVHIINQTGESIFETSARRDADGVPSFLGYSGSGVVTGDLIYVNYGRKEDFEKLKNNSIFLNGSIAIMRYGWIFRGSKVSMAYANGAKGVILYSDPADYASNDYQSWWLSPNAVQRGSVYPGPTFGDPLTHGLPSTPGMFRRSRDDVRLPKIPVHVISYKEAEQFLKGMKGPEVPDTWKGKLNVTYRFGPGFQESGNKVRLEVHSENVLKNVSNVIGTIKGSLEPDRVVLIGSHRDAWTKGVVDSISGTSVIMEIARAVGALLSSGWRPRRTIKFCSWSAEEYALIGSTEYVEQNYKLLSERAVAYLNLDLAVCGNFTLKTYSSPLLNNLILDAIRNISDPFDDKRTLYDVMTKRNHAQGKPNLMTLATFSDYAPFYQYLAIPSIDYGYFYIDSTKQPKPYPIYHSLEETYDWMKQNLDPNYNIHLTLAKLGATFLLSLADDPLLPMNSASDYTKILNRSLNYVTEHFSGILKGRNISLLFLKNAVENFQKVSREFEKHLKEHQKENDFRKLRVLNDQMMQVEKAFLHSDGLPGRREFKHLIFAPSLSNTYASANFPGVTDALAQCENNATQCNDIEFQISLIIHNIQQAVDIMKPIL